MQSTESFLESFQCLKKIKSCGLKKKMLALHFPLYMCMFHNHSMPFKFTFHDPFQGSGEYLRRSGSMLWTNSILRCVGEGLLNRHSKL